MATTSGENGKAPLPHEKAGAASWKPKTAVTHAVAVDAALDRVIAAGGGWDAESPLATCAERRSVAAAAASTALGVKLTGEHVGTRITTVRAYRAQLARLLIDRGVTQRTPEWYAARMTLVTASDVAQCLGCSKFGNQREFFIKKCGDESEQKPFNASLPPLKWGVMYEPVAQALYAALNGVAVHEFGLLRHPTETWLGASPDGITDAGVLLEIKCPWRRRITPGDVPLQYYYQVQAQLDVCDLEECDYFECEFDEYEDHGLGWSGAFAEVVTYAREAATLEVPPLLDECPGLLTKGESKFVYPPDIVDADAAEAWLRALAAGVAVANQGEDGTQQVVVAHRWHLRACQTVRLTRDAAFVQDMLDAVRVVWGRVGEFRADRAAYVRDVLTAPAPKTAPGSSGPNKRAPRGPTRGASTTAKWSPGGRSVRAPGAAWPASAPYAEGAYAFVDE